jgi:hypothetical protein
MPAKHAPYVAPSAMDAGTYAVKGAGSPPSPGAQQCPLAAAVAEWVRQGPRVVEEWVLLVDSDVLFRQVAFSLRNNYKASRPRSPEGLGDLWPASQTKAYNISSPCLVAALPCSWHTAPCLLLPPRCVRESHACGRHAPAGLHVEQSLWKPPSWEGGMYMGGGTR